MNLPQDLTGLQLVKRLEVFSYRITRQTARHIRIRTLQNGEHHLTLCSQHPLKVATLSAIVDDIAQHFNLTHDELLHRLF